MSQVPGHITGLISNAVEAAMSTGVPPKEFASEVYAVWCDILNRKRREAEEVFVRPSAGEKT